MQRAQRLRRRRDFSRVVRDGAHLTTRELSLHYVRRHDEAPARIGLAVGRRIGGAVERNRARRLLREAVRPLIPRLVACDIVITARPDLARLGIAELQSAVAAAAGRAGLILSDT